MSSWHVKALEKHGYYDNPKPYHFVNLILTCRTSNTAGSSQFSLQHISITRLSVGTSLAQWARRNSPGQQSSRAHVPQRQHLRNIADLEPVYSSLHAGSQQSDSERYADFESCACGLNRRHAVPDLSLRICALASTLLMRCLSFRQMQGASTIVAAYDRTALSSAFFSLWREMVTYQLPVQRHKWTLKPL